jgi:exopolyphosphatase/pppGpp-phosphohydrolase
MRYAVFDLGSNSIKFLVVETRGARTAPGSPST